MTRIAAPSSLLCGYVIAVSVCRLALRGGLENSENSLRTKGAGPEVGSRARTGSKLCAGSWHHDPTLKTPDHHLRASRFLDASSLAEGLVTLSYFLESPDTVVACERMDKKLQLLARAYIPVGGVCVEHWSDIPVCLRHRPHSDGPDFRLAHPRYARPILRLTKSTVSRTRGHLRETETSSLIGSSHSKGISERLMGVGKISGRTM